MAKFTQSVRSVLLATTIAGLSGCSEKEKAPPPPPPAPAAPATVGGSVSGLVGEIVLQLNGGNDLTMSADGRFKFPNALKKGSSYAVTVKTQPSLRVKQTCTVAEGSGSITGKAVSNVAITCTTNSYAVGGNVKGLSGKGLVLELKGAKEVDVKIAKNGNFVFPDTRLFDGSDYSIAIKTTPAGQRCELDSTNTPADRDTINIVAVRCFKKGHR